MALNIKDIIHPMKPSKDFQLYILIVFLFIISSIIHYEYLNVIVGDFFNVLWWTIYCIIVSKQIDNSLKWKFYLKYVSGGLFIGGFLLAVLSLYKFSQLTAGIYWEALYVPEDGLYIEGTSLNKDYNIFSLGLFICVFGAKYFIDNHINRYKAQFHLTLLPMLIAATLSTSRRALLLLALTLLILLLDDFTFNKKSGIIRNLRKGKVILGVITVLLIIINYQKILDIIGISTESNAFISLSNRWGTIGNAAVEVRQSYFDYGLFLFSSRNIFEMIVGDGFKHMQDFKEFFNSSVLDHPHNFIISSLLYGGLFSTILLSFLIFKVGRRYLYNLHYIKPFFYWFVFCIIIALTSSNTIFSSRLNVILLVMPLVLLKYSHNREVVKLK